MNRLIDTFPFYNELELLELRLEYLNDIVDKFILVEGIYSHQGKKKDLYFEKNKSHFKKYLDKIEHIIVDDYPLINGKTYTDHFTYDYHTRNAISKGIDNVYSNDNDIIMISDVDEFPDKNLLNMFNGKLTVFKHYMFYFKFNLRCTKFEYDYGDGLWAGTRMLKKKDISTPQAIRMIKPKKYPWWRIDRKKINFINGGWHFRYLGNGEQLFKEFQNRSIGYTEERLKILSSKDIEEIIKNGKPLIGDEQYSIFPEEKLPKNIVNKRQKFENFFI